MAWAKLGTTTLASPTSSLDITGTTPAKFNTMMLHTTGSQASVGTSGAFRLGNGSFDSGSNYASRESINSGSDGTRTSQSNMYCFPNHSSGSDNGFLVGYICNISSEEKLIIWFQTVDDTNSGSGSIGDRMEAVGKWTNTSVQADQIQMYNSLSRTFSTDSNFTLLGTD